jgi:hypothetical protein
MGPPDLYIYRSGASTPLATERFEEADGPGGRWSPDFAARGLAWSADGSRLYAVLQAGVSDTPALSVSTSAATYAYDSTVHVTARLGATDTNRAVSIYAQPAGGVRTLVRTGRVTASGTLTASYVAAHSTTFTAVFSGDAKYEARVVTRSVGVHAKVSATISGYYAITGSTTPRPTPRPAWRRRSRSRPTRAASASRCKRRSTSTTPGARPRPACAAP